MKKNRTIFTILITIFLGIVSLSMNSRPVKAANNVKLYLNYWKDSCYKTCEYFKKAFDCAGRIMNGWWSARYDGDKDVHWTNGLWELPQPYRCHD